MYLIILLDGKPISIAGIEIPSDNPFFLLLIGIHVSAALVCVIAGLAAMLSKKESGIHPKAGTSYYVGLKVVLVTVILVSILRWKEDYYLFVLGVMSFVLAFVGRRARRQKWKRWPIYHVSGLGLSYIILVTAFYLDNGRFLPVWRDFPRIVYWTLPGLIGIPIILVTLFRHPVVKRYNIKRGSPLS